MPRQQPAQIMDDIQQQALMIVNQLRSQPYQLSPSPPPQVPPSRPASLPAPSPATDRSAVCQAV